MLGEEFKTWSADPFLNATYVTMSMHITNLGCLENGSSCFTELLDGVMEKLNRMLVGLNIAVVISETNNQDLPDPIDLEVERANKKKKKAKGRRQRKINLV